MGLTICKHHGKNGIAITCVHVARAIDEQDPIDGLIEAVFPDQDDIPESFRMDFVLYYCRSCASDYGFPNQSKVIRSERMNSIYDSEKFVAVCASCFREITGNAVRKSFT